MGARPYCSDASLPMLARVTPAAVLWKRVSLGSDLHCVTTVGGEARTDRLRRVCSRLAPVNGTTGIAGGRLRLLRSRPPLLLVTPSY
jgi:hypothetical protein